MNSAARDQSHSSDADSRAVRNWTARPLESNKIRRWAQFEPAAASSESLFESLFILPAHLGHGTGDGSGKPSNEVSRRWRAFQDRIAEGIAEIGELAKRRRTRRRSA